MTEKGAKDVSALLKSRIHSGSVKVQRYLKRSVQFHQNNLFKNNQSYLDNELSGQVKVNNLAPDAQEATSFWRGIWSEAGSHDQEAEWLGRVRQKYARVERQGEVVVNVGKVKAGVRRLSNWKAPGPDGVVGFWFKKLTGYWVGSMFAGWKGTGLDGEREDGSYPEGFCEGNSGR